MKWLSSWYLTYKCSLILTYKHCQTQVFHTLFSRCSLPLCVHAGLLCVYHSCHPEGPSQHGQAEGLVHLLLSPHHHHCFLSLTHNFVPDAQNSPSEAAQQNVLLFVRPPHAPGQCPHLHLEEQGGQGGPKEEAQEIPG